MSDEHNCGTCANRHGWSECYATGRYCEMEAKNDGKCMKSGVPHLWVPRPSMPRRVIRFFIGVKA